MLEGLPQEHPTNPRMMRRASEAVVQAAGLQRYVCVSCRLCSMVYISTGSAFSDSYGSGSVHGSWSALSVHETAQQPKSSRELPQHHQPPPCGSWGPPRSPSTSTSSTVYVARGMRFKSTLHSIQCCQEVVANLRGIDCLGKDLQGDKCTWMRAVLDVQHDTWKRALAYL